jgi:hypothetical protein
VIVVSDICSNPTEEAVFKKIFKKSPSNICNRSDVGVINRKLYNKRVL